MNHTPDMNDTPAYDVAVIGGGPAGMMAAITAAQAGAKVVLLEKNHNLGKKLLITGGGRCNVTNNKPNVREMLSQYKTEGKFLFSTFMQHGVAESMQWFESRDVPLKEENEGRLFPVTESAQTIRDVLADEIQKLGIEVRTHLQVNTLHREQSEFNIVCKNNQVIMARTCILATGGTARPETGSTGEGLQWLAKLGHTVVENSFALVPITLSTQWTKNLSGITLPECKVTVLADGKKYTTAKGKILFTHVGLTGPTILNLSKTIGELLSYGPVTIQLDVFPGVDSAKMNELMKTTLTNNINKKVRNSLSELLPTAVIKELLMQCGIDPDTQGNAVTKTERVRLIEYMKAVPLSVSGLLGKNKAVASAGGVLLKEIDFRTMESTIVPQLYLTGDVLNINRPSGGYSLQLCWSTGVVAGEHAANSAINKPNEA